MSKVIKLSIVGLATLVVAVSPVWAQSQYIGYVYPAGGQQGTTFPIRLGGQGLMYASGLVVTGDGVSVRLVDYFRVMSNQELSLLRQQLRALQNKKVKTKLSEAMVAKLAWWEFPAPIGPQNNGQAAAAGDSSLPEHEVAKRNLIKRIQMIFAEDERNPAVRSHRELVFAEVTIAPDAKPGRREIRVQIEAAFWYIVSATSAPATLKETIFPA